VSTKFSVRVNLLVKINVLSDFDIRESMYDISAHAECSLYVIVLWKISFISEKVVKYTLYEQNVAFAVCVTVTYWETWKNNFPELGIVKLYIEFSFAMPLV